MPLLGVIVLIGVPAVCFGISFIQDIIKIIYICIHWKDFRK